MHLVYVYNNIFILNYYLYVEIPKKFDFQSKKKSNIRFASAFRVKKNKILSDFAQIWHTVLSEKNFKFLKISASYVTPMIHNLKKCVFNEKMK